MKNPPIFMAIAIVGLMASCKKDVQVVDPQTAAVTSEVEDTSNITTSFYNQKAIRSGSNSNIGGYLEHLPRNYNNTTRNYPLLIFIHGIGELGNGTSEIGKVVRNSVPRLLQDGKFPSTFSFSKSTSPQSFIVVSPQFKHWPGTADVNAMVDYAIKKYRVNKHRIYMTGLSMGGGVVMDYAAVHGERLAAIVPMAEASYPTTAKAQAIAKKGLPVWAFHNSGDNRISSSYTVNFVKYINNYHPGKPVFKTIFNAGGHNCWAKASDPNYSYNGKNIYEWMLQFTRR